jgi:CubicO group peptidase (beta-lactamase class C family)
MTWRVIRAGALAHLIALASFASADEPRDADAAPVTGAAAMPGLEGFVDGAVSAYMAQQKVAGVQVAVVKDGETLLVKGYGIDAVEPRRAVDPTRSLFRVGSISKTFTWLSLMQLAERGRLEITDPVNDHLPDELDIPDQGFEQPIRIVDLMNHTAGFEDILQRLFTAEEDRIAPLTEHLRTYRPRRVREPGKLMSYSNYSTALAGAIVANVSGMDFETYIERNVLAPLGLAHTTFREQYAPAEGLPQPMSAELAADKAQNIEWRDGAWATVAHEHIASMAPAGAAVSTAADIARYMNALLDPQQLERAGVLRAQTFERMKQPSFQGAPGMAAMHHGFFNMPLGTTRALGFDNLSHSGSTLHFNSFMVVIPDLSDEPDMQAEASQAATRKQGTLGIFVTTNSSPGARLAQALPEQILAQYFSPLAKPALTPPDGAAARAREYAGAYRTLRRSFANFEKIRSLPALSVTATADGYLVMNLGSGAARFVEIAPDLFRRSDGDATVAFLRGDAGKVTHLVTGGGALDRVGALQTLNWVMFILGAAIVTCIGVLVGAVRRGRVDSESPWQRRSARVMTGAAIAWLASFVLCAVWAGSLSGPNFQDQFVYTYPQGSLKVALAALLLAAGLSVLAVASLVPVWKDGGWSTWRRVRHSAAVVVLLALVLTLLHWNAVGFRYF